MSRTSGSHRREVGEEGWSCHWRVSTWELWGWLGISELAKMVCGCLAIVAMWFDQVVLLAMWALAELAMLVCPKCGALQGLWLLVIMLGPKTGGNNN